MVPTPQRVKVEFGSGLPSDEPRAWIQQAQVFLNAVAPLWTTSQHMLPSLLLLGYAMELGLKGYLLEKRAATLPELKALSHDLSALLQTARAAGLPADLFDTHDIEQLDALFHSMPGFQAKGLRAAVYPASSDRQSIDVSEDFLLVVTDLIEHCATEILGPRDPEKEREMNEQMQQFGHKGGGCVVRTKPVPPPNLDTSASEGE